MNKSPALTLCLVFVPLIFLGSAVSYVWKTEIRGFLVKFGASVKGSGDESTEATSTSRLVAVKGGVRRRKRIDVEHGES